MNLTKAHVAAAVAAVALCTACSANTAPPPVWDNAAYAATVCVDGQWVRVPDNYCPIGDGIVPNHPFHWVYDEYRASDLDVDVVYVGYPVERTRYVNTRPARVPTLNLDRGGYPERAAPGTTGTSQRVPVLPVQRQANVQRGGFGAPNARATAAPIPSRGLNSPAPGRVAAQAAPAPRATPPRPASRPMTTTRR